MRSWPSSPCFFWKIISSLSKTDDKGRVPFQGTRPLSFRAADAAIFPMARCGEGVAPSGKRPRQTCVRERKDGRSQRIVQTEEIDGKSVSLPEQRRKGCCAVPFFLLQKRRVLFAPAGPLSRRQFDAFLNMLFVYKNIFDIGICYKLSFPVSMNQGPCVFHHLRPEQSDREKT